MSRSQTTEDLGDDAGECVECGETRRIIQDGFCAACLVEGLIGGGGMPL